MKYRYIVLILIIIAIVCGGLYLNGFFSPFMKEDFGSNKFSVPQGFNVSEKTDNTIKMTNTTHHLMLERMDYAELDSAVQTYKDKFNDVYNITISDVNLGDTPVKKTEASKVNDDGTTDVLTKYWFIKGNSLYDVQSLNDTASIEPITKEIINSFE